MKTWLALLCALLVCAVPALAEAPKTEDPLAETYCFIVRTLSGEETLETALAVDADLTPVLEILGEPTDYFESESCAFQGMDKVYTFASFVINTYPQDGQDKIMSIYLMDDTVETAEGAYIGMHADEIIALYGEPTKTAESSATWEKGGCALAFLYDADGCVSAITYASIAASAQ